MAGPLRELIFDTSAINALGAMFVILLWRSVDDQGPTVEPVLESHSSSQGQSEREQGKRKLVLAPAMKGYGWKIDRSCFGIHHRQNVRIDEVTPHKLISRPES